ncbi:choice-of-anchor D domain-containing protein [Chloroflexota bacterium]
MEGFLLKGLLSLVILTNVIFTPGSSSFLSINPDENRVNAFLSGIVYEPDIDVSPGAINFLNVPINSSSVPRVVTVTNKGDAGLEITGVNITSFLGTWDYAFSIVSDNASGKTIASGESVNISVTFNPTVAGIQLSTLRITSDDPDENRVYVRLYGTGVEDDTTDPYTCCHDPADSDTDVPINTNIVLHVLDDSVGVNQSSIDMTVEGVAVTPTITGTAANYTLTYDPTVDFAYL